MKDLFKVKTFISIALTVVFCIMALQHNIDEQFLTIYSMIIAFYFGTQYERNNSLQNLASLPKIKEAIEHSKLVSSKQNCNDLEQKESIISNEPSMVQ